MKRIICLLLALLFLMAGTALGEEELRGYDGSYVYVTFGRYPQSIDGGAPYEPNVYRTWTWAANTIRDAESVTPSIDPIMWRILSREDDRLYLLSEFVLFASPLHVKVTEYRTLGKNFANTELSAYLNSTFLSDAFSEDEQTALMENSDLGKVFLLSTADSKKKDLGFGTNNKTKAWGTEYAIRVTGLFVYRTSSGSASPYWLMDQSSSDPRHARCTKAAGDVGHIIADRENEGVRPAVWLDSSLVDIVSGEGTYQQPYVLCVK